MKNCSKCKKLKPLSEFYNGQCADGKDSWCKRCQLKQMAKWRRENPEKARNYRNKWREANREKYLLASHKYYKRKTLWLDNYKLEKGCAACGYKKYAEALDFHHIKSRKHKITYSLDKKKIKREIDRCVVLCANCHRLAHAGILDLNKKQIA